MRLTIASLRRVVKGDLVIQFVPQALTSYGGLELLRRYLRRMDLAARLRHAFAGLPSDYGSARLALVLLALFYAGARRLEHLRFLSGDPLVTRFCGLARLPTRRTVANWLRQFTQETLAPLVALNRDLVTEALARLDVPRLTIDVDGTVIRTGTTVGWAFRGFNPHHRKDPSYYPLLAHVAQTGHILRLKNRPGNVHDSGAGQETETRAALGGEAERGQQPPHRVGLGHGTEDPAGRRSGHRPGLRARTPGAAAGPRASGSGTARRRGPLQAWLAPGRWPLASARTGEEPVSLATRPEFRQTTESGARQGFRDRVSVIVGLTIRFQDRSA